MNFEEDLDFESEPEIPEIEPEPNPINTSPVDNFIQPPLTPDLTNSPSSGNTSPVEWKVNDQLINGSSAKTYTFANSLTYNNQNQNPYAKYTDVLKVFSDIWKQNFGYIKGPFNPAFQDATLSYLDILWGYHLEYNPNGILWRVNAAGIPHPEDYGRYVDQNIVIALTDSKTAEDVQNNSTNPWLQQNGGGNDNKVSILNVSANEVLRQNNIGDYFKKLQAKGITGIVVDGEYADITVLVEKYIELEKTLDIFKKRVPFGDSKLADSSYYARNLLASGKFTVAVAGYFDFDGLLSGYDPFPIFPFSPKGTTDFTFKRSFNEAEHAVCAKFWDYLPAAIDVAVTINPALLPLKPYYVYVKPVVSAVCEVEKNMHIHWEDVESGKYSYRDAIKESLLPLGIELGPGDYTAKKLSHIIIKKYNLPEAVSPILENVLSKIISKLIEGGIEV